MKSWPRSTVSPQGERPSLPSKPTSATAVNPAAPGDAPGDPPSGVIAGRQQAAPEACHRRVTGGRGQPRSSATGLIRSRPIPVWPWWMWRSSRSRPDPPSHGREAHCATRTGCTGVRPGTHQAGADPRRRRACRSVRCRIAGGEGLRKNVSQPRDRRQRTLLRQSGPLATHDEVIDAEDLAITRDLLLH